MARRPLALSLVGLAAALVLAAVVALPAAAQKEQPAARADRRFAHDAHAAAVAAKGRPAIACDGACHEAAPDGRWLKQGKAEHTRCFEGCHTFQTSCDSLAAGPGKVCVACHVNLKSACVPRGTGRLDGRAPEMPARYSHKKHIRPGAQSGGAQCEGCHGSFAAGAPRAAAQAVGHAQCASCHERGLEPFMRQCAGCHAKGAAATPAGGTRTANPYAVTGAFDHARHAAASRVGPAGRACLACHANIAEADSDTAVPLPTMRGCFGSCHDGKQAFSVLGATCTKCHQGGRR